MPDRLFSTLLCVEHPLSLLEGAQIPIATNDTGDSARNWGRMFLHGGRERHLNSMEVGLVMLIREDTFW